MIDFENFQPFQAANNAIVNKQLLSKDYSQGNVRKA